MGQRSFISSENVEFSGLQKLAYPSVIRRKISSLFTHALFLHSFFFSIGFLGMSNT